MKALKFFSALVVIALFSAFFLNAQPKGKDMQDKLNLTDQQKDKIGTLRTEHQKKMIDLKASLEKNKIDLREMEMKNSYNRNDYLAAVEKISQTKGQIGKEMANHRMDVYEQLNPDQKKIFNERPFGKRDGKGFRGKGPNGKGMHMGMGEGMGPRGDCPCMKNMD